VRLLPVLAWCFSLVALPLRADALYVTNERAGTVQVIDTASDRVVITKSIGNRPRGLVVAPNGKSIFIASSWWRDGKRKVTGKEGILHLDAKSLAVKSLIAAGTDPEAVAVSPDGQRLYLSNEDAGTASILSVAKGTMSATLITGTEPEGVAVSPNGRWVYVTAETSNTITVIDAQKERVVANILVDPRPRFAVFTRDSKHAWVSAEIGGTVSRIDVQRHRVVTKIKLGKLDKPVGLVLSPDETRLYVATGRGNGVVVVDTVAMKPIAWIPAGERVWGLAGTADGKKVYAAGSLSNSISVIDTATNKVVRTIKTDDGPWGLAIR
jgi:PQQ-dependent catabolism-associated beta-propeller protein